MSKLSIADVELVRDVLERIELDGRGGAAAVAFERGCKPYVVSNALKRVETHFDCKFVQCRRGRSSG